MRLAFLDREEEQARLRRVLRAKSGSLAVLYGRRRCGKSRLLLETIPEDRRVYYVGDDREEALQRSSLAAEIARCLPGFDRVEYPEWDALFARWWEEAPRGVALVLDEFPALASVASEIPSLLQRHLDRNGPRGLPLVLSGSSQSKMQGLVLDRNAPLYGRATEILRLEPLLPYWARRGLGEKDPVRVIEAYSVWGGIPRYWELAREHADLEAAIRYLILSPLGVLHDEPSRLLLDDLRDTAQAASILTLIGRGCHRPSEIAARLQKPATSLSRPLQRLTDLGLVRREVPFGAAARTSKKARYRIDDPFLRFWFRFVEPNRSLLEGRRVDEVLRQILSQMSHHVSGAWEELARRSTTRLDWFGKTWKPAQRWWGAGNDRKPMELDLVAESTDGSALLLGEVKWERETDVGRSLAELESKASRLPIRRDREIHFALWSRAPVRVPRSVRATHPGRVLDVLR